MRCPFTRMRPFWIFSRWLRQRMSVVLPEPEAPTTTTTSPRRTASETPFSTSTRPKDLCTSVASTTVSVVAAGRPPIAERISEEVTGRLAVPLQPIAAQPLEPAGEEPVLGRLALGRLSEARLDPALREAPERRQRQVIERHHEIELEHAEEI